ncbi:hypothetical protein Tco_0642629 [Tanacetum coccineum]
MAKKSSIPRLILSADDDNIGSEEDVVMTTQLRPQTSCGWTSDEEKLLCEVWSEFRETMISGMTERDAFWGRL